MNKKKVDHTYRDFSRYLLEGGHVVKHKKSDANFPAKLHQLISEPRFSHIIAWMPHGRAWKILDKELLISEAVPLYFTQSKFQSFTRQLSCWGFKRLHKLGADFGCYYNEAFLRGIPLLTGLIMRVQSNQGKSLPYPEGEPDFYYISALRPLSTPPMTLDNEDEDYSTPATARPAAAEVVATAKVITKLALQSKQHHTPPYNWDNMQTATMPTTKEDSSTSFSTAATTMSLYTSSPHVHSCELSNLENTEWPLMTMALIPPARDQDSSGSSGTAPMALSASKIPSYYTAQKSTRLSAKENSISSSRNVTAESRRKKHLSSYPMQNKIAQDRTMPSTQECSPKSSVKTATISHVPQLHHPPPHQMEHAASLQRSRLSQSCPDPVTFLAAPRAASPLVDHQKPPYQITRDEQNSVYNHGPYLTSPATAYNDPQYQGSGFNYFSTHDQHQLGFSEHDVASPNAYEGEDSFENDMNKFFDMHQFKSR